MSHHDGKTSGLHKSVAFILYHFTLNTENASGMYVDAYRDKQMWVEE